MSSKQIEDLKKSLKKFDLVELPVIDLDNKVIAGHQRLMVLKLLGRENETISVRLPNRKLTQNEYNQYLLTSNSVHGDWDFEKLKSFDLNFLLDVGFDQMELASFWDTNSHTEEDSFDVEKELQKIKTPITKLGDIITLGRHKIICGDSTNPQILSRLFGSERASMIYSDPVYNIDIDYDRGIGGKKAYGGSVNDSRTYDEYQTFIQDSISAALSVSLPDTHIFYWCDQTYIGLVQQTYRILNIENRRVCLWLKNNQNPVPTVAFNKVYEPVVYGTRRKPYLAGTVNNLNEVLNKEFGTGNELLTQVDAFIDVWTAKRMSGKEYEHATSKPVSLHEKAIKRCTRPGDIILDSFLGSGSTLLAGEQLGRTVYGCELEPRFCDLIIRRFEKLTGIKAIIEHGKEK